MTEKTAALPLHYTLAVPDPARARLPGQFTLSFTADGQWVRHRVAAWSVGLKWVVFEYDNTVHDPKSPLLTQGLYDEYLASVEQPGFEDYMHEHLDRHIEMHEVALMNGLEPGGRNDLPTERILIDRILRDMARGAGIDLHGRADAIGSDDYYIQFLANSLEYMGQRVDGRHFQLRQTGLRLPIMSTFMPIGRAQYCGHALDLDHHLPGTVCIGAVGRRLGDVVETGIPELDARIITEVITSPLCVMDHWPHTTVTRFRFKPDLVEIGR